MRYMDEFQGEGAARVLASRIAAQCGRIGRRVRLMEVCGSHTVAIHRNGLRDLFPRNMKLVSGPGCPVCVTAADYVDSAIKLASQPGVIITTFGDMLRVPGSWATLTERRAAGADVRVCYSPTDALQIAADNPSKQVIFLGVGFETTIPAIAGSILESRRREIGNFSVLSAFKTIPHTMRVLVADPSLMIDGFICPAHVSAVIGANAYRFLAEEFKKPCVVAGFEPLDILYGVLGAVTQMAEGRSTVENQYDRVVKPGGNLRAQSVIAKVFQESSAVWRGIGEIPESGYAMRAEFAQYDAWKRFDASVPHRVENPGCRCGDVLRGAMEPPECPLFGKVCTPDRPTGPCMVSTEGSCAAFYKYSRT
ncbi:MAG: hydrogenase formation protein HypD [Myxococcota bacterium]|jgi:hydrogenase expression/formation protein HypD